MDSRSTRIGLVQGVLAYGLWGVVAAYWKLLRHVDPIELVAHRAVWGLGVFAAILAGFGQWPAFLRALRTPRAVGMMAVSGGLLAVNWSIFVAATISGHLLDVSLGYFINPLVSIALGTLVLRERLRALQWVAIGFASAGVALITWQVGQLPRIALALALTFGLYGLLRKRAPVDALVGSALETLLMAPIAIGLIALRGGGVIAHTEAQTIALLVGTGVVTAVPLVLFTSSARRLPLSTTGFLQYLAPTGHFLLAILAFGEPLHRDRIAAFALIWLGLAVFSLDLARASGMVRSGT